MVHGNKRNNKDKKKINDKDKSKDDYDSDPLADIVAMSNDDEIRNKKKKKITDEDSDENYSDDDDYSDEDDEDSESDDESEKIERKGRRHNEGNKESDFDAATIKAKKAKPSRHSEFTNETISEVQRSNGVDALSNKFNKDLHQIQIALPYGQTPNLMPMRPMNYQLTPKKKKAPFWKKRWFGLTLKVVVGICANA